MGWWKPPPAGSRRHGYRPRWSPLAPAAGTVIAATGAAFAVTGAAFAAPGP